MIKLGSIVKDTITGFTGIAVARCEYLNGCVQYEVQLPVGDEVKEYPKSKWIDGDQLQAIEATKTESPTKNSGGPHSIPIGMSTPN